MKIHPKAPCLICKGQLELITCHCQNQPQQRYFCWTCKQHYPLKYGLELQKNKASIQKAKNVKTCKTD